MGKTGMTRRIDELGRLVIPKEIRKNLKIKDNDQVEITVIDDKIILSRYESVNKDTIINLILNTIKKAINKNILFTSRNHIIDYVLSGKEKIEKEELSEEIMNIIENRKDILNYSYHHSLWNINPIIINGDLYGSLIVYSDNELNNKEKEIIKFSKMFLENYLE